MEIVNRMRNRFQNRRDHGFSLIELMVSLGVLSIIVAGAAEGLVGGIRAWMPRQSVAQLYQNARDAASLVTESVHNAGSGVIFNREGGKSTFGVAVIPRKVTGDEFGKETSTGIPGDGGAADSDEVTLVGASSPTAVVVSDNGAGLLTLTYFPMGRASAVTGAGTIDAGGSVHRTNVFEFFNRLFRADERSYYYPGISATDVGQLMVVRSLALGEGRVQTSRYRMVRVVAVEPGPEINSYNVSYAVEQALPFNRWMQEITTVSGLTGGSIPSYYDSSDPLFNQYTGGGVLACDGALSERDALLGLSGTARTKCTIASMVFMHTYYIMRPTSGGFPMLARYDYTGPQFPDKEAVTIVADNIEDMQIEYFFGSDPSMPIPRPGALGISEIEYPVPVILGAEPITADITTMRFSFLFATARMSGASSDTTTFPVLSNRIQKIPEYNGINNMARISYTLTAPLKSFRFNDLGGTGI